MTKEDYDSIIPGDVVESDINQTRKVIIKHYSKETITQMTKSDLYTIYKHYKIITKINKVNE